MNYTVKNVTIEDDETIEVIANKFRKGIKKFPEDTALYLVQLSIAYRIKGDYQKSVDVAKEVMNFYEGKTELSAEDKRMISEARHVLADGVDPEADANEESLGYWLEEFNEDPNYENMERLGDCYFDFGQYDKAEEYYYMLLTEDVHWNVDTYVASMTKLYKKMGKKKNIQKDIYDKAFAYYEAELNKHPEIPEHHKILGDLIVVYDNLGNESKAAELEKEADALVYLAMKDFEKYERFLMQCANDFANYGKPELSALLFEMYFSRKEKEMSKEIGINFRKNFANCFKDGNNFPKAIEHYLIVLEHKPDDVDVILGLGTCYFLNNRKEIAKPYLERYLELCTPTDPRTFSSLAICFMEDNEFELAVDYFIQAAELDNGKEKGYQAAMYNIIGGIYWKNLKDAPNSFKYYRLSMESNPEENVIGDTNFNVLNMSFKPQGHELAQKFWKDYPNNKSAIPIQPSMTKEEIEALPYHHSKIMKTSDAGYDDFIEKLEEEFMSEFNTNPAMAEHLKKYEPASARKFVRHYAEHKARMIQGGEYYSDLEKDRLAGRVYDSKNVFDLIFQKKLFNIQILWRADNITIPEIEFSGDFDLWRERAENCPFLEEVTREEVELMKRFLMDDSFSDEPKYWLHSWQDYDNFMEEDEDGEKLYMPEWYNYYDSNLATGALLSLPDVRGPKEKFYLNLGAQDYYQQLKAQQEQNPVPREVYVPPPIRFYPNSEQGEFNEFISKYENSYIQQLQKGWMELKTSTIENYPKETIDEAIATLEKADEQITLRSDLIWYEAIFLAARNYKNKQIAKDLEALYEEYLMKRSLPEGINLSDDETDSQKEVDAALLEMRNTKANHILRGRELKGESKDFSFLK